jgi:hypothetical protein
MLVGPRIFNDHAECFMNIGRMAVASIVDVQVELFDQG